MPVGKPRRRMLSDLSDPNFKPERRKAWKQRKRSDLQGYSTRHQALKAEKRAAKRAARAA